MGIGRRTVVVALSVVMVLSGFPTAALAEVVDAVSGEELEIELVDEPAEKELQPDLAEDADDESDATSLDDANEAGETDEAEGPQAGVPGDEEVSVADGEGQPAVTESSEPEPQALSAGDEALVDETRAQEDEGLVLTAQAVVGSYGVNLSSASYQSSVNPYYASWHGRPEDGGGGQCTWYAWGRAYEKLGVSLPGWSHAKTWTGSAAAGGVFHTGTECRADSIMVEDDPYGYGHVMFVERVEGNYAYISEGNWDVDGDGYGFYHEDRINLNTRIRDDWPGHVMGSLTYIYLTPSSPTAQLSVERKYYNPGDTVTFYFGGENTNGTFTLGIYKELDRYKTVDVNGSSYSIQLNEVASYSAYMTSYGISGGYADSNWVDWQVLPLTAELSADKAECNVGDSVTLSFGGHNSNAFSGGRVTLAVWRDGEYVVHKDVTERGFTVSCDQPGEYTSYMTAYGGGTYADSNWVQWTVYPLTAELSADKAECNVGDSVTLSFGGHNSNAFSGGRVTLAVWRDGEYVVHKDVTERGFTVSCDQPGEYTSYMTAYGGGTYADSNWVQWTVLEAPRDLSGASVSVASATYTGQELRPKVTVKLGGVTLVEGTDYTVAYSNNVEAGTGRVTVTGKGSYCGTATGTFSIAKADQTITASNRSVAVGKTVSLGASASGGGALSYASSDTSVATVSASGVVTGKGVGTATVTVTAAATADYNSATKRVTVTVTRGAQTITASDKSVAVGKTVSLGAVASGGGALSYKSSDASVATVSSKGVVTGKAVGTATVTVTAAATADYNSATKAVTVTVTRGTQTIAASDKSVAVGKTVSLGASASGGGNLSYKSSDTNVATVSSAGVVTGRKAGTATITITAAATENYSSATRTVTVTVTRGAQTITAADKSVAVGKTVSLGAKASGGGKLTYKSSDTGVATVSAKGVVTGKAAGTATVTITAAATADHNSATRRVTITVVGGAQTITASNRTVKTGQTVSLGAKASGGGKLTYKSSDTRVATVSAKGVVTGKDVGTAKITITAAATGDWGRGTKVVTVKVTAQAGAWRSSGGRWWYEWADGGYPRSQFLTISGVTYWFDSSGWLATGWTQVGGKWYYFGSSGAMVTSQWVGNYWLGADGVMATNAWVDGGRYWVGADGAWVRGKTR